MKRFAKIIDKNTVVSDVLAKHCLFSLWDSGIFKVLIVNILKKHCL